MTSLKIKAFDSIQKIEATVWDQISAGKPFQSYRWYVFGEKVMSDCPPVYLLAYQDEVLVARASFWLIRNEPIPGLPGWSKRLVMAALAHWPLLICRSPLSNSTGLVLSEDAPRLEVYSAFAETALKISQQRRASFVVFDYLTESETHGWPTLFAALEVSDPGTIMSNRWESLEAFLESANKKDRQHYKRTLREAEKLGIKLSQPECVTDLERVMELIGSVDQRHQNAPNPWLRSLLENFDQVQGTWIEAHIGDRLVGGGLLLEDNDALMPTALALEYDVPYIYFMLIYAGLKIAFEKQVRLLRWGSGAYEVKKQLGFELEQSNYLVFCAENRILQKVGQWLGKLV